MHKQYQLDTSGVSLLRNATRFGRPFIAFEAEDDDSTSATTDDSTGKTEGKDSGDGNQQPTYTQADINRIVSERLARQEAKHKQEQDAAKDAAEAERLKEEGKHEERANKAEARAAELQAEKEQLEAERANDRKRSQLEAQARTLGMEHPEDAGLYIQLSELEDDDAGKLTNAEALLKQLFERRPGLKATSGSKRGNEAGPPKEGDGKQDPVSRLYQNRFAPREQA